MKNLTFFKLKDKNLPAYIHVVNGTGYQFGHVKGNEAIVSAPVDLANGTYTLDRLKHGINSRDSHEIPPMPTLGDPIQAATIPVPDLKNAASFASTDYFRPNLACLFFDNDKIVATDAHRLIQIPFTGQLSALIPHHIIKLLPNKGDAYVSKHTDSSGNLWISIGISTSTILLKQPSLHYPDYMAVIPQESYLLGSISFSKPSKSDLSKLAYLNKYAIISASGIYGLPNNDGYDLFIDIKTQTAGDFEPIKVSTKLLIQCLEAVSGDSISIKYFGQKPIIINDSILLTQAN